MKNRLGRSLGLVVLLAMGACAPGPEAADQTVPSPTAPGHPSPTPAVQDIMEIEYFAPLDPGTYSIDPDVDPSTQLRVLYEIPAEGWWRWIGAAKAEEGTACSSTGCPGLPSWVGVSITTVTNLVGHGCRDHSWANPPVGPSVNDLATALADLAPFRVTSPAKDVTIYGYSGKHLELTVPDLPVEGDPGDDRRFTGCVDGNLKSWVAAIDTEPGDAFYGYTGPGFREEFWILDVDGTRLMIVAERSPGSPRKDIAEQRAILDSIRIEP
jgi:hypothetical protein